jgi:hypothetical protein
MLADAPGRFSTKTGCFSASESFAPTRRAVMSACEPAAKGTTSGSARRVGDLRERGRRVQRERGDGEEARSARSSLRDGLRRRVEDDRRRERDVVAPLLLELVLLAGRVEAPAMRFSS